MTVSYTHLDVYKRQLLAQHNVNILDISQTILQGDFTMVMLVDAGACDKMCIRDRP